MCVGGQVLLGSILSLLVHIVMLEPPATNLAKLWKEIQTAYIELDVPLNLRFGSMKMSMFSKARVSGNTSAHTALHMYIATSQQFIYNSFAILQTSCK